jgi:hypothetical protein
VRDLWNDLRHSFLVLLKNPGFACASVTALALGIGANTAIFSVVNTVLLTPLTYPNADRMVDFLAHTSGLANNLHSMPEFHFFERQKNLFKEVVAYDNAGPGFNLTGGRPEQVHGIHVTQVISACTAHPLLWDELSRRGRTRPTAAKKWYSATDYGSAGSAATWRLRGNQSRWEMSRIPSSAWLERRLSPIHRPTSGCRFSLTRSAPTETSSLK